MKITNQKVLDLAKALNAVSKLSGAKFAYAVSRNLEKLKSEINSLNASFSSNDSFIAYDKERAELAASLAEKNPDGSPKIENESYVMSDQSKFEEALGPVKEKHKLAIEEREKQIKDFEQILKEEIEIDLYTIPAIYLPDAITADQLNGILLIVDEEKK